MEPEVGGVISVGGVVHHPVYHVGAVVVEGFEGGFHVGAGVGSSQSQCAALLGPECGVSLLCGAAIPQVGEGGHAHGFVPRGKDLPPLCRPVGEVDAGIEVEAVVEGGVAGGHEAYRECEVPAYDVVFGIEAQVGAFGAAVIHEAVFSGYGYPPGGVEWESQVSAQQALVSHFGSDGGASQGGLHPCVEAEVHHVGAVEVFACCGVSRELEVVGGAHPRDCGLQVECAACLCAEPYVVSACGFPLVGVGGGIEGVGSEVVDGESGLCLKAEATFVACLPVGSEVFEVAVLCGSVAAGQGGAEAGVPLWVNFECLSEAEQCGAVASQVELCLCLCVGVAPCDDVDGSAEGLCAHGFCGCSFEHFDAFYVAER